MFSRMRDAIELSADTHLDFVEVSGPLTVVLAALMYSLYAVGSKPLVTEYGVVISSLPFNTEHSDSEHYPLYID